MISRNAFNQIISKPRLNAMSALLDSCPTLLESDAGNIIGTICFRSNIINDINFVFNFCNGRMKVNAQKKWSNDIFWEPVGTFKYFFFILDVSWQSNDFLVTWYSQIFTLLTPLLFPGCRQTKMWLVVFVFCSFLLFAKTGYKSVWSKTTFRPIIKPKIMLVQHLLTKSAERNSPKLLDQCIMANDVETFSWGFRFTTLSNDSNANIISRVRKRLTDYAIKSDFSTLFRN